MTACEFTISSKVSLISILVSAKCCDRGRICIPVSMGI